MEEIGRFVILNLTNKNERWSRAREFDQYGFTISYSDKIWEQAKQKAREQKKLLLVQAFDPDSEESRTMDMVLNRSDIIHKVDDLCVSVRDVKANWDALFSKIHFKESTYPVYLLMTPDEKVVYAWHGVCSSDEFMNSLMLGLAKKDGKNLQSKR